MSGEPAELTTAMLDVHPMLRASEKAIVERVLEHHAGVGLVDANPVAQTATVTYDPAKRLRLPRPAEESPQPAGTPQPIPEAAPQAA